MTLRTSARSDLVNFGQMKICYDHSTQNCKADLAICLPTRISTEGSVDSVLKRRYVSETPIARGRKRLTAATRSQAF